MEIRQKILTKKQLTQEEYLENVLQKELLILQEQRDITSFFNDIQLIDEENLYTAMYYQLVTMILVNDQRNEKEKVRQRNCFYFTLWSLFSNVEQAREKECIMKRNFTLWLKQYHSNYMDYFKHAISFKSMLSVLLKYTGFSL